MLYINTTYVAVSKITSHIFAFSSTEPAAIREFLLYIIIIITSVGYKKNRRSSKKCLSF